MKALLTALFPPGVPAVTRWRLAVCTALAFVCIHVVFAHGLLPYAGSGFAYADDVKSIKVELIGKTTFDTRVLQCKSLADPNQSARNFYAQRMRELKQKYREVAGVDFDEPRCEEL